MRPFGRILRRSGWGDEGKSVFVPSYRWDSTDWGINTIPDPDRVGAFYNQGAAGTPAGDLLQGTEANQPDVGVDGDGKSYAQGAAGRFMECSADVFGGRTGVTVFCVCSLGTDVGSRNLLDSDDVTGANRPLVLAGVGGSTRLRVICPSGNFGDFDVGDLLKHVIAVRVDTAGSTNADRLRFWLDGVEIAATSYFGTVQNSPFATGTGVRALTRYDGANAWGGGLWLAEVSALLTPAQIVVESARLAAQWSV